MAKDRPYVVNGEVTKWFWQDVDAADTQARERIATEPKCQVCGRPMCLKQQVMHHTCAERRR